MRWVRRSSHCLVRRFRRLHRFRSRGTGPCARSADTRTIWSHPGCLRPSQRYLKFSASSHLN
jgi:hypothetical protein